LEQHKKRRPGPRRLLDETERRRGFVISSEHPADLLADRKRGLDKLFVQRLGTSRAQEIALSNPDFCANGSETAYITARGCEV
jgi:hypothetical protein